MALIQSCRLVCTERGHNKEYNVELHEERDRTYRVDGRYGRIGAVLTGVRKYNGTSRYQAEAEYNKVRNEKLGKGYREVPLTNAFLPDTTAERPARTTRRQAPPEPAETIEFYDSSTRHLTL